MLQVGPVLRYTLKSVAIVTAMASPGPNPTPECCFTETRSSKGETPLLATSTTVTSRYRVLLRTWPVDLQGFARHVRVKCQCVQCALIAKVGTRMYPTLGEADVSSLVYVYRWMRPRGWAAKVPGSGRRSQQVKFGLTAMGEERRTTRRRVTPSKMYIHRDPAAPARMLIAPRCARSDTRPRPQCTQRRLPSRCSVINRLALHAQGV